MMRRDTLFQECVAEFVGTFFFMVIGIGSVATLVLVQNYSSFWELSCLWGIAVACGIYISGGVSGAHLNPAVTIAFAVTRGFSKKKILPFIMTQVAGACIAAIVAYTIFSHNILEWEATNNVIRGSAESQNLACIFSTFGKPFLSTFKACAIEGCITALFMMVIMAVSDAKNPAAPGAGMGALLIGGAVAIIGGAFGSLTGFALNPARDFGPRIFLYVAGWGDVAFPGPSGYFWVPIIGPILGASIGAVLYQVLIHRSFVKQATEVASTEILTVAPATTPELD